MNKTQLSKQREVGRGNGTNEPTLDEGEIHELLRNNRRRAVLRILHQTREAPARDIAEQIATEETGKSPPSRNDRQSVYISLIQTHLPKLDETGTINYDERAKHVTLGPAIDQLAAYTGDIGESTPEECLSDGIEDVAQTAMLAAVVASWLLASGAAVGLPAVAVLSPAHWSALGVAAVAGVYAACQ